MNQELLRKQITGAFENFETAVRKHRDLNTKRPDGGWSVGAICDHIIKSTQPNLGPSQAAERPYDQHAEDIRNLFLNFQMKFEANPRLLPDEKEYSHAELLQGLAQNKAAVHRMIDTEDLTEICIAIELPVWGHLTKYEWLVLFENHLIRHTRQVEAFKKAAA